MILIGPTSSQDRYFQDRKSTAERDTIRLSWDSPGIACSCTLAIALQVYHLPEILIIILYVHKFRPQLRPVFWQHLMQERTTKPMLQHILSIPHRQQHMNPILQGDGRTRIEQSDPFLFVAKESISSITLLKAHFRPYNPPGLAKKYFQNQSHSQTHDMNE